MHGVMMRSENEPISEAGRRLVRKELDDNQHISEQMQIACEANPAGHHMIEMSCSGRKHRVILLCVHVDIQPDGSLPRPCNPDWAATKIEEGSNRWIAAEHLYTSMLISRLTLARGIREALKIELGDTTDTFLSGTCHMHTPRGFYVEPVTPPDQDPANKIEG